MKKTNFDRYLKQQMKDPAFATGFEQADEAWNVSLQLMNQSGNDELFLADLNETMEDFKDADHLEWPE